MSENEIDVPTLIWCLKAAALMPSDPRHKQTLLLATTVIEGQASALRAAHLRGLMEAREIVCDGLQNTKPIVSALDSRISELKKESNENNPQS